MTVGNVKWHPNLRIYPCAECGTMRSKNEGGTTFTVCDECWDKHFKLMRAYGENGSNNG